MANAGVKLARKKNPEIDPEIRSLAQQSVLSSELSNAIANDFNNIMMAVTSYAELEIKKAPPTAKRNLEQVLRNLRRATYLVQKLIAQSRTHSTTVETLDINKVISGLADVVSGVIGGETELVLQLEYGVPEIKADQVELDQLLIALAAFARDRMPGKSKMYLATKSGSFPGGSKTETHAAVMLSMSDSEKAKSLQPASIAALGSGQDLNTDLILTALEEIAQSIGGICTFQETDGMHQLAIYVPGIERHQAAALNTNDKGTATSKTILIVDDDDSVRIPAVEFLKMEGFKVLQAKTGTEALGVVMKKQSPVDLLITDMVMPAMSGHEVVEKLREIHPDLKVLYISGDSGGAAGAQISQQEMLHKPFRLDSLKDKIQSFLHIR